MAADGERRARARRRRRAPDVLDGLDRSPGAAAVARRARAGGRRGADRGAHGMTRVLLLTTLLLLALPGAAAAQSDPLAGAESGLRGHFVYVAPGAAKLSTAGRARLEQEIARRDVDLKVALLPENAGTPDRLAAQLYRDLGSRGAVAVAAGKRVSAGPGPTVRGALQEALRANNDVEPTLLDFVKRLDAATSGAPTRDPRGATGRSFSPLLLILALGAVAFALVSFSRGRAR